MNKIVCAAVNHVMIVFSLDLLLVEIGVRTLGVLHWVGQKFENLPPHVYLAPDKHWTALLPQQQQSQQLP